jgi:hypothetical protein
MDPAPRLRILLVSLNPAATCYDEEQTKLLSSIDQRASNLPNVQAAVSLD